MKTKVFLVGVALVFAMNVFFIGTCSKLTLSTPDFRDDAPVFAAPHLSRSKLTSTVSATYPTVSCKELLSVNKNNPQNASDPNESRLYGRYIATEPSFWISLHNEDFDSTRWQSIMKQGRYYELKLGELFTEIITSNTTESPVHVVDVGANIGWFTLLSVASALQAGKRIVVDAFEPNPRNHLRFCESMLLNQWLDHPDVSVNLYSCGVTSPEKTGGSGQMNIGESGTQTIDDAAFLRNINATTSSFPLVSLDDLSAELGWNKAMSILKVDVEGNELDVFRGARNLLQSGHVGNIFSEGNIRFPSEMSDFQVAVNLMMETGYKVNKIGGWAGPDRDLEKVRFPTRMDDVSIALYINGVMGECAGWHAKKRSQCNLWWRRRNERRVQKQLTSRKGRT